MLCLMHVLFYHSVNGQTKRKFNFPEHVSAGDFENGVVWVKLKESHRDIFMSGASAGRKPAGISTNRISPLLNAKAREKTLGRIAPRRQHVDISLYYKLSFDKTIALEDFVNELYATGYFEVVEPVHTVKPFFTPDDPSSNQQYYLDLIRAPEAWDITTGNQSIIIGIVDTGGDLNHPDLQDNLYIDPADPVDGVDNDGDGFVDNNRGWDFSGADVSLIGTPGFIGDNDPSISQGNLFAHGTMVAGCASASTNNGIGISSVGYNTKLLFTKHFADNQPATGSNYSSNLYEGILYAATHGAKIINCSWGGYYRSTIAQDIIEYVTLDLGCLVVAAAGNSNLETPIYPAAYEYVLSVASSDAADVRSKFSNFGKTIDIISPGTNIFTTTYDNAYGSDSGTSLSAPIVSGAAALVWAQNPLFTPLQVGEQLRVSADERIYNNNPLFTNKLGKGRLDVARALTVQSPSIRAARQQLVTDDGQSPDAGDSAKLLFDFTNYLLPSSNGLTATLTSSSPYIAIVKGEIILGSIGENVTVRNSASPFEIILGLDFPVDQPVEALLTYSDGEYQDFQLLSFIIPSYIDIDENNIITSITTPGRIGFGNVSEQNNGSGFIYDEESMLYEMGLIMGTSSTTIYNNVRGINDQFDQDFSATAKLVKMAPGERSYAEITGRIRNDEDAALASLDISYQSLVWKNDPYRDFIILEYKVKNITSDPISDFYFGIFADWDIASAGAGDRADWDNDTRLGYVFPAQSSTLPRSGIQALSGTAHYYAIDNDQTIAGNPFGIYDGFTDNEKFLSISSGLSKVQAGNPTAGSDVSHVVSSGPYFISPGEEVTIAFALHAAKTNAALIASAKYADTLYNFTLKASRPIVENMNVCYGDATMLQATGASNFNWYTDFTGGDPIYTGAQFNTPNLFGDTTFFVSNADNAYESLRSAAAVSVWPSPEIQPSGSIEFCDGETVVLSVGEADEYTWSTGQKTQTIDVTASGQYSVVVRNDALSCASTEMVDVKVNPSSSASFSVSTENPMQNEAIIFSPATTSGVTWFWEFGDGSTSKEQSPSYAYVQEGEFTVTLSVISENGCEKVESKTFGIVTGVEDVSMQAITVHPNPVHPDARSMTILGTDANSEIALFDAQGKRVSCGISEGAGQKIIDAANLTGGIYMLRITTRENSITRKIVITR